MVQLTIEYCLGCSDTTEHLDGKCHPCHKKQMVAPVESKEWAELDVEGKLDYLYKRIG